MDRVYKEAFSEVDEIIRLMPIDLRSKIPMYFRQAISENKASNYRVNIQEPLEEQKLKQETVIILGVIYRDFLASPEKREQLQQLDEDEIRLLEQSENLPKELIIYKEPNIFKRIINFLKKIFK